MELLLLSQSLLLQVGLLSAGERYWRTNGPVSIPSSSGRSSKDNRLCLPTAAIMSQSLLLQVGLLRTIDFVFPLLRLCLNPFFFRSVF